MNSSQSEYSSSSSSSVYRHSHRAPPPPPPSIPGKYLNPKMLTLPHQQQLQHHPPSSPPPPSSKPVGPFSRSRSTGNLAKTQNPKGSPTAPHPVPIPATSQLSDLEIEKVEMFYRSHRTALFVGRCLVNLYITETDLVDGGRQSRPRIADWKLTLTGVPVLIFNKGETKSRDKRQVQICLAERGTGFPLWSDLIDSLSSYSAIQPTFHTLYLSTDHRKMAGLSFDCPAASVEFYQQIEPIISNPLNISLCGPKKTTKARNFFRSSRNRSKSVGRGLTEKKATTADALEAGQQPPLQPRLLKLPNKVDISSPCLFQHVTSVNMYNREQFPSILTSQFTTTSGGSHPPGHHRLLPYSSSKYGGSGSSTASSPTSSCSNQTPVYSTPEPIDSAGPPSSSNILGQSGSYGDLHHSGQSLGTSSNESNLSY